MQRGFYQTTNLIAFVLCCFIGLASCERSNKSLTIKDGQKNISTIFKPQLKTSFCAFNIVQIKDSAFFNYGVSWTDAQGKTYQYVFSIKNYCDFTAVNLKADETFDCKIIEKANNENCIVCMGFMETPPLYHSINIVKLFLRHPV